MTNYSSGDRNISWPRLGRAHEFYKKHGYSYCEVPWIVHPEYTQITYPESHAFTTKGGDLIGSAEQGFLALSVTGRITPYDSWARPKYYSCSPCFRDNQPDDDLHHPYFMKMELYLPASNRNDVYKVVMAAAEFFRAEGALPEFVKTEEGWDINVGGVEVGSYGFRDHEGLDWVYGTGLAEPRFSQALVRQKRYVHDKLVGSVK